MKALIKKLLREGLENKYQDQALDRLKQVGSFDKLSEVDKLILLAPSKDIEKLKKLNLLKIYKDLGGTFGNKQLKVRVKSLKDQFLPIANDKEYADKEGYLSPYINYNNDNPHGRQWVSMQLDDFIPKLGNVGGGSFDSANVSLDNIFPIDYNDKSPEFVRYEQKCEQERKEFMDRFNDLLGPEDDFDDDF